MNMCWELEKIYFTLQSCSTATLAKQGCGNQIKFPSVLLIILSNQSFVVSTYQLFRIYLSFRSNTKFQIFIWTSLQRCNALSFQGRKYNNFFLCITTVPKLSLDKPSVHWEIIRLPLSQVKFIISCLFISNLPNFTTNSCNREDLAETLKIYWFGYKIIGDNKNFHTWTNSYLLYQSLQFDDQVYTLSEVRTEFRVNNFSSLDPDHTSNTIPTCIPNAIHRFVISNLNGKIKRI